MSSVTIAEKETETTRTPQIALNNTSKIYHMGQIEVKALDSVSLDIMPGEFIVLLGPSGSGKTTMLNLIGGLDTPTSGTIVVGGNDIATLNAARLTEYRRKEVGFVFQFFNLIPTLTAKENVEFAGELAKNRRQASELLTEVGLGERIDHFPSELSGGENQRVAIARALATNPGLLLCDEPTGSLDFETGKLIFKLLRTLNETEKKTIVIVTHNAPVGEIADRIVRLRDGKIWDITVNEHPLDPGELKW
jgi:putative ABC transport system ATP-binding protein